MSFSITVVGKPEAIKRKLVEQSTALSGQSKEEFDAVLPALNTILDQNVGDSYCLRLDASGHAGFKDGLKQYGACSVSISNIGQIAE